MANLDDQDNYTAGRRDEQLRQQEDSGVQGLLIGVLLFLGVCGIAAALFFSNRNQAPVTPVVVPSTAPASPPVNENRETIIREKSTEVVPVPVSPAPAPNVNITVPSSQPSQSSTQPSSSSSQPSSVPSSAASSSASPSTSPSVTESAPANPSP
jgi:hypothetical protein